MPTTDSTPVDVLIVGSGPVGSAVARTVHDLAPRLTVRMVERGFEIGGTAGGNVLNVPEDSRAALYARLRADESSTEHPADEPNIDLRPGTRLVDRGRGPATSIGMPAAAESTNVGGMGAFWSCACPRPADSERIPFISDGEMQRAFSVAERLLSVNNDIFASEAAGIELVKILGELFDWSREGRPSQSMPLACAKAAVPPYRRWSGADTVLGELASSSDRRFTISSATLCRRLVLEGGRVTRVVMEDLQTGDSYQLPIRTVVVAADTLRTPQLLWASGIRPAALGRYINDQARIVTMVRAGGRLTGAGDSNAQSGHTVSERLAGMFWVPYSEPNRLYQGQITLTEVAATGLSKLRRNAREYLVGLTWYVPKELRYHDRVWFDDATLDDCGMPAIQIDHERTDRDRNLIDRALEDIEKAAETLGHAVRPGGPRLQSAGSSLHYQGSVRMGPRDDGESVCDTYGHVWGLENLFVSGNGIIPTSTACNPTLTSVALAVRTAQEIARVLG